MAQGSKEQEDTEHNASIQPSAANIGSHWAGEVFDAVH